MKTAHALTVHEHIDRRIAHQVPALDQRRRRPARNEHPPCALHRLYVAHRVAHEHLGLVEIRRDERSERDEQLAHGGRPRRPPAARRPTRRPSPGRPRAARAHGGESDAATASTIAASASIPVFVAAGRRSPATASICDSIIATGIGDPPGDATRVLSGDRRDRRGAEHPKVLKCLEVSLNARAAPRVGAGDREGDGRGAMPEDCPLQRIPRQRRVTPAPRGAVISNRHSLRTLPSRAVDNGSPADRSTSRSPPTRRRRAF